MADQSPQDSSKPLDLKGPTPLVAVGVVLTIFLVALLIGNLWTSYSQSDQESAHETGLIEMAGRIALYDEILTMSCRMAAATGDTYWEERYYRYAPLLEELLQRALRLAPPAVGRPLAMTESANQRLVAMEEEALRLLKQGRADQARAILASAAYRSQKEAYGGSLSQALAVLHEHGNRRLAEHINRERWTLAAAMVAVVVLLLAWARVLLVVHRHQRESQRARRELDEHQVQLEEVVARRTGELEKANHELSLEVEQRRAAQEAHRRSEENYRAIFDSVNDAIFVHDPATGAILEANQRCIQMYGYTLAELRQRRAGDLSPGVEPYTPTAAAANLAQVMAGEPRLFEWRAKSKKGRLFWVEVSLKLARWNDRSVIMAVVRDISSRKEAEELLHIQQEQLRLFISHAPAAIAMFDDRMRYLLYSRRWLEDYGLGERDLTGLSHYEVFPEVPQRWKEVHNRCLSGAVERVEEEPFPRADGSLDWVRWEVRPWRDAQDEIGGVIMLTEVLTERKQVQDQLELSAKVFENSVEGVFVTDHQGVIQWVNRAFTIITGHSPEDAVGHTPRLLKSDRHPQEFYRAMWDSLVTNGEWRGEIWNRRKNGEAFLEWQTILAIRDDQGRPVRYVSIFYDITDIRQSEQQIEYQSNYDALTGLPNRTLLVDRMRVAFEHADRNGRQAALLSLDLDNFKHVNDGLGYASGDTLLQMVADRLAQPVGPEHTLSRPGGDEFLILVEEIEDARQAVRVAQWISTRLSQPFLLGGQEIFISVSIASRSIPTTASIPRP